mmetsp:Transcript_97860/g.277008  ORF Transcript_97860/g.277008 Transcript_97860/m.277008 type:complete len:227 (+) Transcript_97860:2247-2927(+)
MPSIDRTVSPQWSSAPLPSPMAHLKLSTARSGSPMRSCVRPRSVQTSLNSCLARRAALPCSSSALSQYCRACSWCWSIAYERAIVTAECMWYALSASWSTCRRYSRPSAPCPPCTKTSPSRYKARKGRRFWLWAARYRRAASWKRSALRFSSALARRAGTQRASAFRACAYQRLARAGCSRARQQQTSASVGSSHRTSWASAPAWGSSKCGRGTRKAPLAPRQAER